MGTMAPSQSIEPNEGGQKGTLQLLRKGAEGPASKSKAVYIRIVIRGRDVDSHLRIGHGRLVVQFVANDISPKSKLVHDRIGEQMRLGDAPDPVMQRDVQRKIQVVRRGYAA